MNLKKMKKGKITITITLGLVCFVLLFVMFMQFKTVEQTDITAIETMRESELRAELSNWKTKYEETNKKLQETIQNKNEYKEKINSNQETSELIDKELAGLNTILGKTDVEGEGVVVTLSDNNERHIEANDLLLLVNELKIAGAEAISINDERIINMSDIVDINNTFIKINGQRLVGPYVVKAIGNQKYLESGLAAKGGYIDTMEDDGKTIKVEKQKNVKILKYNDEFKLKYIELK
ncbi:MAG: DUF881 domain-containing protein [Clostridia bacterium]